MRYLLLAAVLLCTPTIAQASTLFEEIGGKDMMVKLAGNLVDRMAKDPQIGHLFDETDLPRLKIKIAEQFSHVAGDPTPYKMANIHNAHSDFEIRVADFNRLVELLQLAMDDNDIPFATQNRLLAVLAPMERQIVNH